MVYYSICLRALRALGRPVLFIVSFWQDMFAIWQTIYGVVYVYKNRVIAEETINDPQNQPYPPLGKVEPKAPKERLKAPKERLKAKQTSNMTILKEK
jgi:hypothetical protein